MSAKNWQKVALANARLRAPEEACGLVVDGQYVPCRNIHPEPERYFEIAPADYAAAAERGPIEAVVHSHVNQSANPSEGDRVQCERSGLPWFIVGLPSGTWRTCTPSGYVMPLEDRPFIHGIVDCWTLIQDGMARYHGITLMDFERTDDWWLRNEDLYRKNYAIAGFTQRIQSGPPETLEHLIAGDMIVMCVGSAQPNHAALYLGDGRILHHPPDRLSRIDTYGGYWRDNTLDIMRHRELIDA